MANQDLTKGRNFLQSGNYFKGTFEARIAVNPQRNRVSVRFGEGHAREPKHDGHCAFRGLEWQLKPGWDRRRL